MIEPSPPVQGPARCPCPRKWVDTMGVLYGVKMMGGYVRLNTDPSCPIHANYVPRPPRDWSRP